MKSLLFNTVIFMLITLSGIMLLLITLSSSSTAELKKIDIKPVVDHAATSMYTNTKIEQHTLDVEYNNFKTYTMSEIEKNNQNILNIQEEINETERALEETKLRRINNLKMQNTQLKAGLNTYQIKNNGWQSFKSNFSTNFKRMALPFSELFPNNSK